MTTKALCNLHLVLLGDDDPIILSYLLSPMLMTMPQYPSPHFDIIVGLGPAVMGRLCVPRELYFTSSASNSI